MYNNNRFGITPESVNAERIKQFGMGLRPLKGRQGKTIWVSSGAFPQNTIRGMYRNNVSTVEGQLKEAYETLERAEVEKRLRRMFDNYVAVEQIPSQMLLSVTPMWTIMRNYDFPPDGYAPEIFKLDFPMNSPMAMSRFGDERRALHTSVQGAFPDEEELKAALAAAWESFILYGVDVKNLKYCRNTSAPKPEDYDAEDYY